MHPSLYANKAAICFFFGVDRQWCAQLDQWEPCSLSEPHRTFHTRASRATRTRIY